ncbi:hypothetical protein IQ252_03735 [Tychonema sp. LEGE 07203]|nr:hypothetical protein [Tychonema sp. LEGE 07203]
MLIILINKLECTGCRYKIRLIVKNYLIYDRPGVKMLAACCRNPCKTSDRPPQVPRSPAGSNTPRGDCKLL